MLGTTQRTGGSKKAGVRSSGFKYTHGQNKDPAPAPGNSAWSTPSWLRTHPRSRYREFHGIHPVVWCPEPGGREREKRHAAPHCVGDRRDRWFLKSKTGDVWCQVRAPSFIWFDIQFLDTNGWETFNTEAETAADKSVSCCRYNGSSCWITTHDWMQDQAPEHCELECLWTVHPPRQIWVSKQQHQRGRWRQRPTGAKEKVKKNVNLQMMFSYDVWRSWENPKKSHGSSIFSIKQPGSVGGVTTLPRGAQPPSSELPLGR